jgi:copper chaperone NosL
MRERLRVRVWRARAACGLFLAFALAACGLPEGPQPIAWDREPCAHCRMLIGDPAFAAQLQLADGAVESFDDPGCLLARLDARPAAVHALWFHHLREERWLPGDGVAFVRVAQTPMDSGLGAVDVGTQGAIPLEAARTELRARRGDAR